MPSIRLEATRRDSKSKLFRVPSKPRLTFDVVLPLANHHGPRPTLAGTHTRREGCNFPLHARRGVNTLGRGPGAFFCAGVRNSPVEVVGTPQSPRMQEAPASTTVSSVNMMVDRLLGCLTHVFDVVRFSILRRSAHMTREELLQAIEDLTGTSRTR